MKKVRILVLMTLLMFSASLLAACGGSKPVENTPSENKPAQSEPQKEVSVDVFQFKVEFKDAFEAAAQKYTSSHPGVTINVTTVGGGADYGAALKGKFNSGEEPAIFNIGGPQDVATWKEKLADVSDAKAAKETLPGLLTGVTVEGKPYGLPYNIEGYGLIYNKDIFAKAGIKAEDINTFAKLEEAVKTLDSKKTELGIEAVFALPAKETWVTGLHMSNMFLSPEFDGDVIKTFNSKTIEFKYADAMKKVLDLQNKYSSQPTASLDYKKQVEQLFCTGKAAMIQQGNWVYADISKMDADLAKDKIGMLPYPIPGFKEDCYPVGVPMYWAVNKNKDADTLKAAKDFLDWLYLSDEGKKIVMEDFKFIPAYKGYPDDAVNDPLGKQVLAAASAGKNINWVFMGYPDGWGMNKLGADIQLYVSGQLDWNKLVENAKATWADARK